MLSCNDNKVATEALKLTDTTGASPKESSATATNTVAAPAPAGITPGVLDILVMDKAAFQAIPNGRKLVFRYIFESTSFLTLHGWISKQSGTEFNTAPDVKLTKGASAGLNYGVNTYFGNVVLRKEDVSAVKTLMTSHPSLDFVLFKPFMDGQHIAYELFLSDNAMDELKTLVTVSTGKTANPSPPRTY